MINRKIGYFITLAECLSFTQTAARHGVSQTAISQYIASLEERQRHVVGSRGEAEAVRIERVVEVEHHHATGGEHPQQLHPAVAVPPSHAPDPP